MSGLLATADTIDWPGDPGWSVADLCDIYEAQNWRWRWRRDQIAEELRIAGIEPYPDLEDVADEVAEGPRPMTAREIVAALLPHTGRMDERDRGFVLSVARFASPSEKQMKWLKDIARKHRMV